MEVVLIVQANASTGKPCRAMRTLKQSVVRRRPSARLTMRADLWPCCRLRQLQRQPERLNTHKDKRANAPSALKSASAHAHERARGDAASRHCHRATPPNAGPDTTTPLLLTMCGETERSRAHARV